MQRRSLLGAMERFHHQLGDVFRLPLPGFMPVMMVGPEANHFLLATCKDDLRWRSATDPVTRLLHHGVLVEDDDLHDNLRRTMNVALHRQMIGGYISAMVNGADDVTNLWHSGSTINTLDDMRKVALLVMTETLYGVDFRPHMQRLWQGVIDSVRYISPGLWVMFPPLAKRGYTRHIRQLDRYLHEIIQERRDRPGDDLLGVLIAAGLDDDLIRDQLMTMVIAGQDTSTVALTWALYLLSKYPDIQQRTFDEIQAVIGGDTPSEAQLKSLVYLTQVINEALRLFPPIHLGARIAENDLTFQNHRIPAGTRVFYSIYLTHRHPDHWHAPDTFNPDRFAPDQKRSPYLFLPFGGGARNCLGMALAQVQLKIVLARLLQGWRFELVRDNVRPYMGATLEPHPAPRLRVIRR